MVWIILIIAIVIFVVASNASSNKRRDAAIADAAENTIRGRKSAGKLGAPNTAFNSMREATYIAFDAWGGQEEWTFDEEKPLVTLFTADQDFQSRSWTTWEYSIVESRVFAKLWTLRFEWLGYSDSDGEKFGENSLVKVLNGNIIEADVRSQRPRIGFESKPEEWKAEVEKELAALRSNLSMQEVVNPEMKYIVLCHGSNGARWFLDTELSRLQGALAAASEAAKAFGLEVSAAEAGYYDVKFPDGFGKERAAGVREALDTACKRKGSTWKETQMAFDYIPLLERLIGSARAA